MAKDFLPKLITFFRLDEHVRRLKLSHEELEIRVETIEDAPSGVGIESISGDYVDNTDPFNPVLGDPRPYKVYTALLNQTGGNAPVATILENTADLSLIFTYNAPGQYSVAISPNLDLAKTAISLGNTFKFSEIMPVIMNVTVSSFNIVLEADDQGGFDDTFHNTLLEIKVYN